MRSLEVTNFDLFLGIPPIPGGADPVVINAYFLGKDL